MSSKTKTKTVFYALGLTFFLTVSLSFGGVVQAAGSTNYPYFRVHDGDVFAGGWWGSSCRTYHATKYQSAKKPPDVATANPYPGGILTFANTNGDGASSDYATFALGNIEGDGRHGFASYDYGNGWLNGYQRLTFANTAFGGSGSDWGGYFDNWGHASQHCIQDYYGAYYDSTIAPLPVNYFNTNNINNLDGKNNAKADKTTGYFLIQNATNISPNKNIALFVFGNVYIKSNITYSASGDSNVPKFVLIVHGNIYVDPNVRQLDGWYITEPDLGVGSNGVFWDCHDGSNNPDEPFVEANCIKSLTINGSLYAKRINFLRWKASDGQISDVDSTGPAEDVNYTPAMIAGASFFKQESTSAANYIIDSVQSLPPVY